MRATNVGEAIRELRQRAGMTQRQLAERAGVGRNTLGRVERGHGLPTWDVLRALVEATGHVIRFEQGDQ